MRVVIRVVSANVGRGIQRVATSRGVHQDLQTMPHHLLSAHYALDFSMCVDRLHREEAVSIVGGVVM